MYMLETYDLLFFCCLILCTILFFEIDKVSRNLGELRSELVLQSVHDRITDVESKVK